MPRSEARVFSQCNRLRIRLGVLPSIFEPEDVLIRVHPIWIGNEFKIRLNPLKMLLILHHQINWYWLACLRFEMATAMALVTAVGIAQHWHDLTMNWNAWTQSIVFLSISRVSEERINAWQRHLNCVGVFRYDAMHQPKPWSIRGMSALLDRLSSALTIDDGDAVARTEAIRPALMMACDNQVR